MNKDMDSNSTNDSSQVLFTRDEVLGGLPAKRARSLLFLIESRTAYLVAQSREVAEILMTENTIRERELDFLEAFTLGRKPPLRPTIQDLERYASHWAYLVPDNIRIRAALAQLLAEKYRFTRQAVPGISSALGLDEKTVQQSYQRMYNRPLETIFVAQPSLVERLRWGMSAFSRRIESLPTFWTAFILSFTINLPQALLAIPIVAAGVGPLVALAVVLVVGVINMLTITGFAESVVRSRSMRYGSAFLGRLVNELLGSLGSNVLSIWFALFAFLFVVAGYLGLSVALESFTGISIVVWPVLLFAMVIYFLSRKLSFTLNTMMVLGAVVIGLITIIALLSIPHWQPENLLQGNLPLLSDQTLVIAAAGSLIGVVLAGYCNHAFVSQISRVVLPRDESARSLIWGSAAGIAAMAVLLGGWILVVNGAVEPSALISQQGTAMESLAKRVGSGVNLLGPAVIILMLGLGTFRGSSLVFSLIKERLPQPVRPILMLPRSRGRLLLYSKDKTAPHIGLTYIGIKEKQPHFRLDVQTGESLRSTEIAMAETLGTEEILNKVPELSQRKIKLALEVIDADSEQVRLYVTSSLAVKYEGEWVASGLTLAGVLDLPDDLRRVVNWMTRRGEVGFREIIAHIGQGESAARAALESLIQKGFVLEVRSSSEVKYRARYAAKRKGRLSSDIWRALGQEVVEPQKQSAGGWKSLRDLIGRIGQIVPPGQRNFLISASPVIIAFLVAEWLLLTGSQSFTGMLKLAGVLTVSLIFGIFPMLLLVSSRRRGDVVPRMFYRFIGHPIVVAFIYLLFLANFFLHGLVIWEDLPARIVAVLTGLLVVGMTAAMVRGNAFVPRLTLELRQDMRKGDQFNFEVVCRGQPSTFDAILGYPDREQHCQACDGKVLSPDALLYAIFDLPSGTAKELKVWAHRITSEGVSESIPVHLQVNCGTGNRHYDLKLFDGQVVLPITSKMCQVRLTLVSDKESA